MNRVEFNSWFTEHAGYFPDLADWLSKRTDRAAILSKWEGVLSDLSKDEALAASQKLYEQDERPRGFGDHAKHVKRIAAAAKVAETRAKITKLAGEGGIGCPYCKDSGLVNVFLSGNQLTRAVRMYGATRATFMVEAFACPCEAGGDRKPAFEPETMTPCLGEPKRYLAENEAVYRERAAEVERCEAELRMQQREARGW